MRGIWYIKGMYRPTMAQINAANTLETLIRSIRGSKEFDFKDGILETTRQSARMLGRTLVNGASNAARMEIYEKNADVLDGVKFLGTFDLRTCPVCANLQRYPRSPRIRGTCIQKRIDGRIKGLRSQEPRMVFGLKYR